MNKIFYMGMIFNLAEKLLSNAYAIDIHSLMHFLN